MDNEQRRRIARGNLILGTFMAAAGLLCLLLVSGQKDTLEYYFSSSRRSEIDMLTLLSWGLLLFGIFDIVSSVVVLNSVASSVAADGKKPEEEQLEEQIECFEGEIIDKEWSPEKHQVEWIVLRQKNGVTVRLWHYIADDKVYKIGDRGTVRTKDRLIAEFVSSEDVL